MSSDRRYYYWLLARDPETGKSSLIYGGATESDARQKGLEMLSGIDFDIKRLQTRNLATASSMIRGKRLEQTHSLRKASERLGHDKSVRRMQRKKQAARSHHHVRRDSSFLDDNS